MSALVIHIEGKYPWTPYMHPGELLPWLGRSVLKVLPPGVSNPNDLEGLLDVGGGCGTVGINAWGIDRVCVLDIFPTDTQHANFTLGNALDAVTIYGAKSFDVVQACEVIEHLTKEDGLRLLPVLESVARKLVILTTPYGFSDQDPARHPEEPWSNNPYQKHLCGWMPEEFVERGYSILLNGGPGGGASVIAYKMLG